MFFESLFVQNWVHNRQHLIWHIERHSKDLCKMKDLWTEGSRNEEAILGREFVGYCKVTFFGKRVSWADDITSAGQVAPDWLVWRVKTKMKLNLGLVMWGIA